MSEKLRQALMDELVGIDLWKVYDNVHEINHLKCMEALLKKRANPNIDLTNLSLLKPYPIFYGLK
jgi:hypothetical protein